MVDGFLDRGWIRFPADPRIADWARHARVDAQRAVNDPALAHWRVCENTWFVGVDALDNDPQGRVGGSPPLSGPCTDFITRHIAPMPALHRAQVSVIYPGYPRPRSGESEAAFRYRAHRDAAHVDGVKRDAAGRRRVEEPHAFILGLPLNDTSPDAAPMVVWQGSHQIMRTAFRHAFQGHAPETWAQIDVTDVYTEARKQVFRSCQRVLLHARPGQAYLLHRLALHGVAPWGADATAPPDGRIIAYFRPMLTGSLENWLRLP